MQPSIFVILPANTVFSQTWANFRELRRLRWNGVTLTYPWHLKASNNIQLIFDGPLKAKEDKVKATYMLLWICEEGRKIFNSFDLTADEKAKPDVIFDKSVTDLEPKSNFGLKGAQLQGFRQADDESVDSFMARCKLIAHKC